MWIFWRCFAPISILENFRYEECDSVEAQRLVEVIKSVFHQEINTKLDGRLTGCEPSRDATRTLSDITLV